MARLSDIQVIQLLQKAARRINRELCLFGTDDEITIDNSGNMTPDDGALYDMVLLQAECLAVTRDFSFDLNDGTAGVFIRDGEQSVDTRQRALSRAEFFDSDNNPCSQLEDEIKKEKLKRSCGIAIW